MTDKEKLRGIKDAIRTVILYPKKGVEPRRTNDGYPLETVYDVFAYKRIVESYRDALHNILRAYR